MSFSMQGKHKIKECEECEENYCVECSDAEESERFCSKKCADEQFQDNNWPVGLHRTSPSKGAQL